MQKATYTNARGQKIDFTDHPPYVFWEIRGLEIPDLAEITTQASGQHGYTLHDLLVESRTVRLSAHVKVRDTQRASLFYGLRRRLNAVCNPLLGLGELRYENAHGQWRIPCYANANPYDKRVNDAQTLAVHFRCPGGFLESADPIPFRLAYIEGGLAFPLVTPSAFGLFGYRVEIDNDGDAPAPIEMYMDGGGINPVIRNQTTGAAIRLKKHLHYYERLYINTDRDNQKVQLVSIDVETNEPVYINAYGHLTDDSELFSLAPGINALTFNSDDEHNKNVSIKGSYRKRYIGV
jgi:hypothetical protein